MKHAEQKRSETDMNILFRKTQTKKYADSDRKYLCFAPIFSKNENTSNNYISITSNDASIDSPLHKITFFYEYDYNKVFDKAFKLRYYDESIKFCYFPNYPTLILVKQTYGKNEYIQFLIKELLNRIQSQLCESPNIHFTHYSLIFEKLPKEELETIFDVLLKNVKISKINNFYFDIDEDYFDDAIALFQKISGNINANLVK